MLTKTEEKVYQLNGACLDHKEIASKLSMSVETVKSHIKAIKAKKKVQRSKELTGLYLCEKLGASYEKVRDQILSSVVAIFFIVNITIVFSDTNRRPNNRRAYRVENRILGRKSDYSISSI